MADPAPDGDTSESAGVGRDRGSPPGTPRWVQVSGVIALVLVVLIVALLLIGGGDHGPGRHTGGRGDTPAAGGAQDGGHTPPAGGHTP